MTESSLAPSSSRVEVAEVEAEVVAHGDVAQLDAALSRSWSHGTRLAWCSISVSTTTSPAPRLVAPQDAREQVERLGRVLREDDLVVRGRARR